MDRKKTETLSDKRGKIMDIIKSHLFVYKSFEKNVKKDADSVIKKIERKIYNTMVLSKCKPEFEEDCYSNILRAFLQYTDHTDRIYLCFQKIHSGHTDNNSALWPECADCKELENYPPIFEKLFRKDIPFDNLISTEEKYYFDVNEKIRNEEIKRSEEEENRERKFLKGEKCRNCGKETLILVTYQGRSNDEGFTVKKKCQSCRQ